MVVMWMATSAYFKLVSKKKKEWTNIEKRLQIIYLPSWKDSLKRQINLE